MFERLAAVAADLRARLAEPHRFYHTQDHVDAMLATLRERRADFHGPDAVELAIWFHDAVYAPGAPDNERCSAALLRERMGGLAPPALIDAAETLILATERHAPPPGLPAPLAADLAAFLDMDMAVLGAAPDRYDRYAADVAREFVPVVGDAAFRRGRANFLRGALSGAAPLFRTARARASLEGPARANMTRELRELE